MFVCYLVLSFVCLFVQKRNNPLPYSAELVVINDVVCSANEFQMRRVVSGDHHCDSDDEVGEVFGDVGECDACDYDAREDDNNDVQRHGCA